MTLEVGTFAVFIQGGIGCFRYCVISISTEDLEFLVNLLHLSHENITVFSKINEN